jgi:hypothetical protein
MGWKIIFRELQAVRVAWHQSAQLTAAIWLLNGPHQRWVTGPAVLLVNRDSLLGCISLVKGLNFNRCHLSRSQVEEFCMAPSSNSSLIALEKS